MGKNPRRVVLSLAAVLLSSAAARAGGPLVRVASLHAPSAAPEIARLARLVAEHPGGLASARTTAKATPARTLIPWYRGGELGALTLERHQTRFLRPAVLTAVHIPLTAAAVADVERRARQDHERGLGLPDASGRELVRGAEAASLALEEVRAWLKEIDRGRVVYRARSRDGNL